MDADVVVVGGGHNGLICAAYLARGGLDTLLVKARPDVGGCASTVTDLGARFNICNCDHTMIRAMPIGEELDLSAHGLRYLENDVGAVHRFHDGSQPWLFFHEIDRHLDALDVTHPAQVAGYRRYLDDAIPVAELVIEMARTRPSMPGMMRRVLARRAAGAARLLDWSRRSVAAVMAEYFDDWHIPMPGISTGPTVWGVPPGTPGTGTAAAIYATRHLVRTGRPAGGSGALTDAVRRSFEAAGGRTRCDSRVDRLVVRNGAIAGVRLADGSDLTARVVVAACDPRRVLLDWIDDPPPSARRLIRRWCSEPAHDGYESKIDAVLDGLPSWLPDDGIGAVAPDADLLAPTTVISPTPEQLAAAHELRRVGEVARHPTMLVNVPTALDPGMQQVEGEHVLSLEVLFTPYALVGGWPGSAEPERWLGLLDGLMEPGTLRIDRWRAMTPDRYESEFSMHRGHAPSFVAAPLVTLLGRQRATTRYRTPIAGLYVSGAGTYPGAGIFGASGRNAAAVVERDLAGARRPVTTVRRFVAARRAS